MKKYNRFFIIIVSMLVVSLLVACKGKGNNDSSSANQETEVSLMTTASVATTEPTVSQETETTKATTASVTEAPTTEYVTTTESTPKKIIADDYWDGDVFDVISYCLDKGYKVTARDVDAKIVDPRDKTAFSYYIDINEKWKICIFTPLFINVYVADFSYDKYVYTQYYEDGWKLISVESDHCYMSAFKSCKLQVEQFLLVEKNILDNEENPLKGIDEKFIDVFE